MSQYDLTCDLKINVGYCDPYFMVKDFTLYLEDYFWYMNTILWDYESVWPDVWPQNMSSTLWLTFHGPVIWPNILKTIQWLNLILWDYESVWPDMWPQNICRSLWPIFHGHLNLFILKTVWCMNIIRSDYESVWHDIWPRNKCWSLWPIFHGPVILPYILNSIRWTNVILLENESVQYDLWLQNKFRSQWPIFHGPVISLLLFFALKNILDLLAKPDSGELRCPATAFINLCGIFFTFLTLNDFSKIPS